MAEPKKAGWFRYLKEAFLYRWNLLVFGGAAAAAAMTPAPDIALPLVAAAELLYLGGLTPLPRFQAAIDAKARAEARVAGGGGTSTTQSADSRTRLMDVLRGLGDERRNRFLRLRARCVEMQRLANAVRGDTRDTSGASHELRTPALDRLLWVFLRLLLSEQALERFLRAADGEQLKKNLADLQTRQTAAQSRGDERILRSLTDSIATAELRVDNYEKARSNAEFIAVELDRIENKIQALTEMAISHQDPDAISAQVDAVAEGMSQTEDTIRQLQAITGMSEDQDATPNILSFDVTDVATAKQ
jgi:signal transduction histidine kinase